MHDWVYCGLQWSNVLFMFPSCHLPSLLSCSCETWMFSYFITSQQLVVLTVWSIAIFCHLSRCNRFLEPLRHLCWSASNKTSVYSVWNATRQIWYHQVWLGGGGVHWELLIRRKTWLNDISTIRKCARCSMTDVLHIWQTSMSACFLGSVRMLNVSTPKEATAACVNQATC